MTAIHRRVGIIALLLVACLQVGSAQPPPVPDHLMPQRDPTHEGQALSFCVDPRDPAHEVDRAIATQIAAALVLEPVFHIVERTWQFDTLENLYSDLVQFCSVYLGFKLVPNTYADWLSVTRPYYFTGYQLVTTNADWQKLSDLPLSEAIGAQPGTAADLRLLVYLNGLETSRRWTRYPEGSDQVALDGLLAGKIGAALVWAPRLWALQREDEAYRGLYVLDAPQISEPPYGVGGVMLSSNTFIRNQIDQAISALIEDGEIDRILTEFGYPATSR